ncbi:uncharacterized protein LOC124368597 [Homalodisca vitripennis]|uniref:uncharacterized protein LOC124368597 n=1 Tax=Homalodisca vitripennis TaxID=197043 RepID=UPI001EEAE8CC|nr:uncharacterized protein LOC124368597 [Homalodisca vitripennis]KAG8266086.1 hypothetical protein J6590_079070 [Homalodisca vitripennis]
MVFRTLICFCLVVAMVCSDTTEDIPSLVEKSPTTSSSVETTLEELKKHGASPMHKGISPRSDGSLFGLGIGANLLGVHAGAGIGHGRGGYGDMGQGFVGKPAGGQYPQQLMYPQYQQYPQIPLYPYMLPQPYHVPAAPVRQ